MGVNFLLFDIANHFNEYCGLENIDFNLCPNDEEKSEFLKIYLAYYLEREPTKNEIEKMLHEIPIFEAVNIFM
jgi:ethanolamine kinase